MEIEYDHTGSRPDVHTFTATDYDENPQDTFTWSLGGDDAADLAIDQNSGVLTFRQNNTLNVGPLPNFEHHQDDDGDGTYSITVIATDNHGKATNYAVEVTVTNVNERPRFTGTPPTSATPDEHDAARDSTGNETPYTKVPIVSYTAHDEEGGVNWTLHGYGRGRLRN